MEEWSNWEYRTLEEPRPLTGTELNNFGQEGWRLVGFAYNPVQPGKGPPFDHGGRDSRFHYAFVRPLGYEPKKER